MHSNGLGVWSRPRPHRIDFWPPHTHTHAPNHSLSFSRFFWYGLMVGIEYSIGGVPRTVRFETPFRFGCRLQPKMTMMIVSYANDIVPFSLSIYIQYPVGFAIVSAFKHLFYIHSFTIIRYPLNSMDHSTETVCVCVLQPNTEPIDGERTTRAWTLSHLLLSIDWSERFAILVQFRFDRPIPCSRLFGND